MNKSQGIYGSPFTAATNMARVQVPISLGLTAVGPAELPALKLLAQVRAVSARSGGTTLKRPMLEPDRVIAHVKVAKHSRSSAFLVLSSTSSVHMSTSNRQTGIRCFGTPTPWSVLPLHGTHRLNQNAAHDSAIKLARMHIPRLGVHAERAHPGPGLLACKQSVPSRLQAQQASLSRIRPSSSGMSSKRQAPVAEDCF